MEPWHHWLWFKHKCLIYSFQPIANFIFNQTTIIYSELLADQLLSHLPDFPAALMACTVLDVGVHSLTYFQNLSSYTYIGLVAVSVIWLFCAAYLCTACDMLQPSLRSHGGSQLSSTAQGCNARRPRLRRLYQCWWYTQCIGVVLRTLCLCPACCDCCV